MPSIEVLLEIPPAIAQGLANGTLERVGGVIREVGNKQVVAWLREGGQLVNNTNIVNGLMGNLAQAGQISSVTGILDTVVSARSQYLVLKGLRAIEMQVQFFGAVSLLNIAISTVTLLNMIQRFQALEKQIQAVYKGIVTEFNRDRQVHLETTLNGFRNMIEAEGDSYKQEAPRLNENLDGAGQQILRDVKVMLERSVPPEQGHMVEDYLLLAMQVDTMRIRCFLEMGEHTLARRQLNDCLNKHQKLTREFVSKWLGDRRALYFHTSVKDDLQRYLCIESWLRGKDDVLMDVIEKSREDFWNQDAIQGIIPGRLERGINSIPPFSKLRQQSKELPRHLKALEQSELLIENQKRLYMCERELDAIERLGGLEEWKAREREALTDKADFNIDEHNDYVLLVDTDMLKRLSA